jgi:hypothetical protein
MVSQYLKAKSVGILPQGTGRQGSVKKVGAYWIPFRIGS